MENPVTLHEDTFYEYFKPYLPAGAENDIWGGHGLETYGSDFDLVRRTDPNFVWTIVDGESDTQWIIPGIYYVNRVCYLVPDRKPHILLWRNANLRRRRFREARGLL